MVATLVDNKHVDDNPVYQVWELEEPDDFKEAWADINMLRIPGTLKWLKREYPTPTKLKDKMRNWFPTDTVYIVGKGPSLDNLTPEYFSGGHTVIGINNATAVLELIDLKNILIHSQVDKADFHPKLKATKILQCETACIKTDNESVIYHYFDLSPTGRMFTLISSIGAAKLCGVKNFKMLCFDALINGDTSYAKCLNIGNKKDKALLDQRKYIDEEFSDLNIEWILPE